MFLIIYFLLKSFKKISLTEERREELDKAIINIEETINEAEKVPVIDRIKLKKAGDKLNKLLKKRKT